MEIPTLTLLACVQRSINEPAEEVLTFPSLESLQSSSFSVVPDSRLVDSMGPWAPELVFCSFVFSSVSGSAWFLLETHSTPAD